jgi:hypothetical protein
MTLGEALDQGAAFLIFNCKGVNDAGEPCGHGGRMNVRCAIERWGAKRKLDRLPLVCSKCGSIKVAVSTISLTRPADQQSDDIDTRQSPDDIDPGLAHLER